MSLQGFETYDCGHAGDEEEEDGEELHYKIASTGDDDDDADADADTTRCSS